MVMSTLYPISRLAKGIVEEKDQNARTFKNQVLRTDSSPHPVHQWIHLIFGLRHRQHDCLQIFHAQIRWRDRFYVFFLFI